MLEGHRKPDYEKPNASSFLKGKIPSASGYVTLVDSWPETGQEYSGERGGHDFHSQDYKLTEKGKSPTGLKAIENHL